MQITFLRQFSFFILEKHFTPIKFFPARVLCQKK
nr:MAG TPA: hypothetical protein [Caudoviricetes sp.]